MSEVIIQSEAQLRTVLDQISFAPSCVRMGWQWRERISGRDDLLATCRADRSPRADGGRFSIAACASFNPHHSVWHDADAAFIAANKVWRDA